MFFFSLLPFSISFLYFEFPVSGSHQSIEFGPYKSLPFLLVFRIFNFESNFETNFEILFYLRISNIKYSVEGAQCHNIQWLPSKLINTFAYAGDTLVVFSTNLLFCVCISYSDQQHIRHFLGIYSDKKYKTIKEENGFDYS